MVNREIKPTTNRQNIWRVYEALSPEERRKMMPTTFSFEIWVTETNRKSLINYFKLLIKGDPVDNRIPEKLLSKEEHTKLQRALRGKGWGKQTYDEYIKEEKYHKRWFRNTPLTNLHCVFTQNGGYNYIQAIIPSMSKSHIGHEQYLELSIGSLGWTGEEIDTIKVLCGHDDTYFNYNYWEHYIHTKEYIKMRDGFYDSPEWNMFRQAYLVKHNKCVRCGSDEHLQVNHKDDWTVDSIITQEGFLESLKHEERFEALCRDCHLNNHSKLIAGEKELLNSMSRENRK